jgi:hypothetical protein
VRREHGEAGARVEPGVVAAAVDACRLRLVGWLCMLVGVLWFVSSEMFVTNTPLSPSHPPHNPITTLKRITNPTTTNPKSAPVTSISSPGRAASMRSLSRMTSFWRGRRPAGTVPGDSCKVSFW